MNNQRAVIIGAVAAGGSAAFKIKRINPEMEVKVFEADEYFSYAACGLPYYISDVIKDYSSMIMRTEKDFHAGAGAELYTRHRVNELDLDRREILVESLAENKQKKYSFDQLLLATGASPIMPRFEGMELEGVFALRTLKQGLSLKEFARKAEIKKIVIIGGSYIGLELAESFQALGKEVRLLEKMPQVMGSLDPDMAGLLEDELQQNGVVLQKDETLLGFEGDAKGRLRKAVSNRGSYEADLAVVALGVKPNSELAQNAGIKLGAGGAISVDRRLQTSAPGVFSAGDCAEAYHLILKQNVYLPLGTTANKQGRIAGENMCGNNALFPGVLGSAVVKVFNLLAARTGLSEKEARENDLPCDSVVIKSLDHAAYYPGSRPLHVKLVFNPVDGRLLGGQLVGSEKGVKRADIIATAISAGLTVGDLGEVDMAYAPPYSRVWDPLTVAANAAISKIRTAY